MLGRTNSGGGTGNAAELTIYGGTTRPAKATQNTIWIDTDVEITSYVLSFKEPETPSEGMAWIKIGNKGIIQANAPVGDNWITVYPITAKQYVSGAWVYKDVLSYQNGQWENWIENIVLFDNGVKRDGLAFTTQYGTATFSGNYLVCKLTSSDKTMRAYVTEQFDLTPYETITVSWEGLSQSGAAASFGIGVYKNNEKIAESGISATTGTHTLDVSNLEGEYDICLRLYSGSSGKTANVTHFAILK